MPDVVLLPRTHANAPIAGALQSVHENTASQRVVDSTAVLRETGEDSRIAAVTDARVRMVERRFFSEKRGQALITELSAEPLTDTTMDYLALASAAALVAHVEASKRARFSRGGLRVRVRVPDTVVAIDIESVRVLELLESARDGDERCSLFAALNRTRTRGGARLLRSSILAPPRSAATIRTRHACVAELLDAGEAHFDEIGTALASFGDLEHLVADLTSSDDDDDHHVAVRTETASASSSASASGTVDSDASRSTIMPTTSQAVQRAESKLRTLLSLRLVLARARRLHDALESIRPRNTLLQLLVAAIGGAVDSHPLRAAEAHLNSLLVEHATDVDGTSTMMSRGAHRQALAFVVRSNIDGALDVARKALSESTADMAAIADRLRQETGITTLCVRTANTRRGAMLAFHTAEAQKMISASAQTERAAPSSASLSLSSSDSLPRASRTRGDGAQHDDANDMGLPAEFVNVTTRGKWTTATTPAFASLAQRNVEAFTETILLTRRLAHACVTSLRSEGAVAAFHRCAESVALLDMLVGFAEVVAAAPHDRPFIQPVVDDDDRAPIALRAARNALVEQLTPSPAPPQVPNDYFGDSHTAPVLLVRGANMSGKSTYLRTVALSLIAGHVGAFVAAEYANIRAVDRIIARLDGPSPAPNVTPETAGNDYVDESAGPTVAVSTTSDTEASLRIDGRHTSVNSHYRMDDIAPLQAPLAATGGAHARDMRGVAFALRHATRWSLVLLDEPAAQTSPRDGDALVSAIVEHTATDPMAPLLIVASHLPVIARRRPPPRTRVVTMTTTSDQNDHHRLQFAYTASATNDDDATSDFMPHGYGIDVIEGAGVDEKIVHRSRDLRRALAAAELDAANVVASSAPDSRQRERSIRTNEIAALQHASLTAEEMLPFAQEMRRRLLPSEPALETTSQPKQRN